ncbi:hypothetical protein AB0C84_35970 [Actinomadura sp. NPDC048955]|uniref:hypothetical protein n=1 Tax=Actinomadura sp. NPDC048955 TaxID=3158228 RepID=UPI0033C2F149
MSEPPQDLVNLKRDFLLIEAGLSGRYDLTAGMQRLRVLTGLIQDHPWWAKAGNAFDARMTLIKAAKAELPPGFPQELPDEMPPHADAARP